VLDRSRTSSFSDNKGMTVLRITSLSKYYGEQRALEGIGFSVQAGEVLGLIGPNGAGKTTLLEAIAGLLPVDSGEIRFRDQLLPLRRRREVIFCLPDGVRSTAEASEIISMIGLRPVLAKRIHALSKGYNRRLIIALGFPARHPILLTDEPFDGFDLRQTRDMMAVLRGVAAGGRTLLLSIHQLRDAEQVCDRLVLLADGRIRGVGTLEELRDRANRPGANLEDIFLVLT